MEPEFTHFCRSFVRPDYVCLDVGASIGVKSLIIAAHAVRGKVVAIEPGPTIGKLLELIKNKPRELNLLITGHDDQKRFIDQVVAVADLATEMRKVKHPFDEGHQARKGLDY